MDNDETVAELDEDFENFEGDEDAYLDSYWEDQFDIQEYDEPDIYSGTYSEM